MKTPEYSYVAVLRAAHPDSLTLREIARQMDVSPASLSLFELGRYELPDAKLAAYCRLIERPVEEVRLRWARQALYFHASKAAELRDRLQELSPRKNTKGQKPGRVKLKRKNTIDRAGARA